MDIIQRPRQPLELPEDIEAREEEARGNVSSLNAFSSGIRRQNWASQAVYELTDGTDEENAGTDLNYRPFEDEANENYPPDRMVRARSADDAMQIRSRIDEEYRQLKLIDSSGWGTAGEIFGGVFRPEVLAGGLAKTIPTMIAAEMGAEAFNESLLHTQQETRTQYESFLNIGMAGAATGILAGAAPLYGMARSRYTGWDVRRKFKPIGGGGDEAAQVDIPEGEGLPDIAKAGTKVLDEIEGKVISPKGRRIKAGPTHEEPIIEGEGVRGWLIKKLSIGPEARLFQSKSVAATKATEKLTSASFMTRENMVGRSAGIPVEDAVESTVGRTNQAIEESMPLQKASGLPDDEFYNEVGIAMSRFDKHDIPEVQQAAELFRKRTIDPLAEDAKALGVLQRTKAEVQADIDKILAEPPKMLKRPTKDGRTHAAKRQPTKKLLQELQDAPVSLNRVGESYFPRIYDKAAIYKNWDQLAVKLTDLYRSVQPELSPEVLQAEAVHTMQNMQGGLPLGSGGPGGKPSALKHRTVELTDRALEKYLDKNAMAVMMRHTRGLAPYIEMKKAFGDETMADIMNQVGADYARLIDNAPSANAKRKLASQQKRDIEDLQRLRDRLLNQVHKENPGSAVDQVIRGTGMLNMTTQLGGIVLSSFPDVTMPLMRYGLKSYGAGLTKAVKQLVASPEMAKASKAQLSRMNVALDRTLNTKMANMAGDMELGHRGMETAGRLFGKYTGFNAWIDAMETVAAHSAMDWTLRQAGKIKAGQRLSKSELGRLGRQGLSHEDLIKVYEEAGAGTRDSILQFADTLQWKDIELAKRFEAAMGGDVRRTILRVTKGDRPLALDDPFKALMFQYSGFAIASTNKILISGLQQADRDVAVGLLAMLGMGAISGAIKEMLRGGDPSKWSVEKLIYEGIDRSGLVGVYRPALSALMMARGEMPSRYLTRSAESTFGGPTTGSMGNLVRLASSTAEGDWEDAGKRLQKAIPFVSNGLHIRQILLRMAED